MLSFCCAMRQSCFCFPRTVGCMKLDVQSPLQVDSRSCCAWDPWYLVIFHFLYGAVDFFNIGGGIKFISDQSLFNFMNNIWFDCSIPVEYFMEECFLDGGILFGVCWDFSTATTGEVFGFIVTLMGIEAFNYLEYNIPHSFWVIFWLWHLSAK